MSLILQFLPNELPLQSALFPDLKKPFSRTYWTHLFCNMHSLSDMKSHRPTFSSSPLVVHTNALFISTQNNAGSHTHLCLKPEQRGVTERQRDKTGERRVTEEDRLCLWPFGSHRKKSSLMWAYVMSTTSPELHRARVKTVLPERRGWIAQIKNVSANWIKVEMRSVMNGWAGL